MKNKIILSDKFLMFVLILSGCFQNIEVLNISDGFGLKLYHVNSILLSYRLITKNKGKIKLPPMMISVFFVCIMIVSAISYTRYGFNSLCINYIFVYYLIILIINIGKDIKSDEWINILKKVALIMIVCIYFNILMNFSQVTFFLSGNSERINLRTFFGGGINLEATWIALLGIFFIKDEKAYIYLFFSMIISMLYSSRSGLIVNILFFTIILVHESNNNYIRFKKTLLLFIVGVLINFVNLKTGMFSYVLNRFSKLGNENGSLGRLKMWEYIFPSFINNPFGYGLGNAVKSLTRLSGEIFSESNVHNMFFQMFLDTGMIGGIMYLYLNIRFIFKEKRNIIKNPIIAFIVLYILLSIIEFRGADFLIYVLISIYILTKNEGRLSDE